MQAYQSAWRPDVSGGGVGFLGGLYWGFAVQRSSGFRVWDVGRKKARNPSALPKA